MSFFRFLMPSLADNQPPPRPRSPSPPPPKTSTPTPVVAIAPPVVPTPTPTPSKPMLERRLTEPHSASQELRMIRSPKGFLHIARQLGKGSFASVYEAWDSSGGQYAVKVITKEKIAPKYLPLLAGEVAALTELKHPNIVIVKDVMDSEKTLTIVMSYAGGSDLLEYVNEHGKFSETEAFGFFSQLIYALEHMHARGFAHRDVKLDNLLLDIKKKHLFLADFGFALRVVPGRKSKEWLGSLSYSAPEILLRRAYDGPELDMWSAGVCLYILVTNSLPFAGRDEDKRTAIATGSYAIPSFVSIELSDLLGSLLTTDTKHRLTASAVRDHPWFATRAAGKGSGIRTITSTNNGLRRSSPMFS